MAQIISFSDLFNFGEDQPIEDAIAKIERLKVTLEGLRKSADQSAEAYSHALNDIAKSAEKLDGDMDSLDATLKEHQDLIVKSATQAEKLIASQAEAAKAMEAERIAVEKLKAAEEALNQAKDNLNKNTIKEAGSLAALRKELAAAVKEAENMGDATDQVVKDAALKRVSELAKNVNTADAALKQAKKGVDVAAGSYNALVQKVEAAKKELKAMEGGIGSNTAEFKALQKTVKDGTDQLKKFDENIGSNTRSVGGYEQAIRNVIEPLQAVPVVGGLATKALNLLSKTPVVLIITALGTALFALMDYFKGSVEGQDNFNKVLRTGEAILETFMNLVGDFGELLFNAISQPKKTFQEFLDLIKPLTDGIKSVFEDPLQAIKDLGDAIVTNVINRFKAIGVGYEGIKKILAGDISGGLKALGNAGIQAATGITDGVDKIADAAVAAYNVITSVTDKISADAERRLKLGERIAALENQLRKDRIADIVDDAKTELDVNELLAKSQDRLKFSAEERFTAIRQAGKLSREQLEGDLKLIRDEIQLQKFLIEQTDDNYEMRQKLAELQAQELGLQAAFFQAAKKRQAQEIGLIREIEKELTDRIKREADAQRQLNEIIIKSRIDSNKQLIADERTGLDDRLALLNENADFAIDLAESNLNRELDVAKEAALQRVELSSETLEAIYNNESLSINERIAQERAAKEELIGTDQAYIDTVTRLNEQFKSETIKINEETTQAAADNVFKQWAKDYQNLLDGIDTQAATEALGLTQALETGQISFKDYQEAREKIQEESQIRSLNSQLDYLNKLASNLSAQGFDVTNLQKQIADVELAISEEKNRKLIEGEVALQSKLKELRSVARDTALQIIDNLNEAEDIKREERRLKLEENYQNELLLAGDNEAAKAELTNQFQLEKDKLDKEQRAAERKRAVFQKTLAVVEIAINTAKGIGLALGTFPPPVSFALAAVVGAIGALQIAAVLSKPIPAFAEGTEDAPGGLALVAEKGPEAISDSKGTRIISRPSIVNLERGARVLTAEDTARMREGVSVSDKMIAGFDDDTQKMRHIKLEIDTDTMTSALSNKLDRINNTLLGQKAPRLDTRGFAREIARGLDLAALENALYK